MLKLFQLSVIHACSQENYTNIAAMYKKEANILIPISRFDIYWLFYCNQKFMEQIILTLAS